MPRPPSPKKQIEQLTKELNLDRGTIQDNRAHIEDLEKRLAAKTEEAATLVSKVEGGNITRIANDHLREKIDELQAVVNEAKKNHKDLQEGLRDELDVTRQLLRVAHLTAATLGQAYDKKEQECQALRKALKMVL